MPKPELVAVILHPNPIGIHSYYLPVLPHNPATNILNSMPHQCFHAPLHYICCLGF